MRTRTISVDGCGELEVPAEPEARSRSSEACLRGLIDGAGEYSYLRPQMENARTALDIGCNLGGFVLWACRWWQSMRRIDAYDPNADAIAIAARNIEKRRGFCDVTLHCAAVTTDPRPLFNERMDWGASRTFKETTGVVVPCIHPSELPAADVLKADAEGIELQLFENYSHWEQVRVALFEWHDVEHREPMMRICERAGLVQVRPDAGAQWGIGIQAWTRQAA